MTMTPAGDVSFILTIDFFAKGATLDDVVATIDTALSARFPGCDVIISEEDEE